MPTRRAAVLKVPDDVWVEMVHAVIVLKEGEKATADGIIAFRKQHLARYETPRSLDFVESLPKNAQGKILKREIRAGYWEGKGRSI
jgi:acyl-CoA synthetase (AMP-forming)/AMP-acid ligase II